MFEKKPTVREFFLVVWRHWGPLMSGVFSVPFVALSVFAESTYGKIIWGVMAAAAFLSAAYLIWAGERKTVVELREKIRPKLKCSFSMADSGCVRPNTKLTVQMSPTPEPNRNFGPNDSPGTLQTSLPQFYSAVPLCGTYYRLKVECDGVENVTNCCGRLESIRRDGQPIENWEPAILPFASAQRSDSLAKLIRRGSPEFLDFMFITDGGHVWLTPPNFLGSSSVDWDVLFNTPGTYTLRINVLSDTPTVPVDINFRWTGDRATSEMTCREANL
jgi:hypothetical protein